MEVIKIILVGLCGLMVIASGLAKLFKSKKVVDSMTRLGVRQYTFLFGAAEIVFALLFIYPPTRTIGFILLICYFSGALATDLSHKNTIVPPLVFLGLLFVTAYMSNPGLFF
jgi:hypothetical protein